MDMVESLTRLGTRSVETSATVEEALRHLKNQTFDFAVLDMNLRGVVSFDIAKALMEAGTPFLFVTGYGSSLDVPTELKSIKILTKPVDDGALSKAVGDLLS